MLAGIIDYAGLFPPAQLPLAEAIRCYARYRQGPDRWMLGHFICPAQRLGELSPFVPELFSSGPALPISALGRGGKDAAEFLAGLRADLAAMARFAVDFAERVEVTVYEVRVPGTVLATSNETMRQLLEDSARIIEETNLPDLTPFYEVTFAADWRTSMTRLSTALAQAPRRGRPPGFKLRCGGLEAAAFPSPEQVAFAITACRDAGVALKFTAGLHHPVRHFDAALQIPMHGFLNVFGAGVLAHARQLNTALVQRILEDEDPEDFEFGGEAFHWKEHHANLAEIHAARRSAVISFGSCSFEEPIDDLRALGLLRRKPAGENHP
jgi:hypothetical protein